MRLSKTIGVVMIVSSMLIVPTSLSFASSKPGLTVKLSNSDPSPSTTIQIKVCWSNAVSGDTVSLEEESTTSLSWRVVTKATISTSSGCKEWSRSTGKIGEFPYRGEVRQGSSVVAKSGVETDHTFGTISATTFFMSELGCQGGGTVSTGAQTYQYFCTLSAGSKASSNYDAFLHPTTCRSLTLRMIATDNSKGSPTDTSNVVVEIQQSGQTQPAIFGANDIENFTYHLNGSAGALNVWASAGFTPGEAVYFLTSGSTAVCASASGI